MNLAARPPRPYPGLRPFEAQEWSIFFGRERMVDDAIARLAQTRVALIHGASGAGKSSLVRAGVLPKLERQHRRHGAPWRTCAMRPAGGPLWNLAAEFARLEGRPDDLDRIAALVARLGARGASLAGVAGTLEGLEGHSVCLLVDQFEELFRFEKETSREEAEVFAELVGRAVETPAEGGADVRVIVTMRSEFLGECARFAGLAETINRTQYLVPRLDDEALLRAVRRPAEIYGGRLDLEVAERLIASVRGREDELPLLQHGLMRMWDAASGAPRVLDGRLVDEAGGLAELLSRHADAVMREAAPDAARERLVERLFRELTDVNAEGAAIRRPRRLRDLAAAIGVEWGELAPSIDAFRAPGVSFLTPYAPTPLSEATQIDISHEALIRCWRRIAPDGWLRAEVEDGLAWRSMLMEARGFERDKRRVLSEGATEDRGALFDARNEAWSRRYGGGWDKVDALLTASRRAAAAARRQRRVRMAALTGVAVGALGLAVFSGLEWRQANTKTAEAQAQTVLAQRESRKAQQEKQTLSAILTHLENVDEIRKYSASPDEDLFSRVKILSDKENPIAMDVLGSLYWQGVGTQRDFSKAKEMYSKAAQIGETRAMAGLGLLYMHGQGVETDFVQARHWFEEAAKAGETEAYGALGYMNQDGLGSEPDPKLAMSWFKKGAEQNDEFCTASIGYAYMLGQGVEKNFSTARYWFERAEETGNKYSGLGLGDIFENGMGVEVDFKKAIDYYQKASTDGSQDAFERLGDVYYFGRGVEVDYQKSKIYYERGAFLGSPGSMRSLGDMYINGQGVKKDILQAKIWYEQAARSGDSYSMSQLGDFYANGTGVQQNYLRARELYERAAKAGDGYSAGQLGDMYARSTGVAQDYLEAREWYEKGVANGNGYSAGELGDMYSKGVGVAQDYAQAREWYEKGVANGQGYSAGELGDMYSKGVGVAQDYAKAREWYEKGAANGQGYSADELGDMYSNGVGVAQDYAKAREWYEKSAKLGSASAMTKLGLQYTKGLGVAQDWVKALQWYEKASAAGNVTAAYNIGNIYANGSGVPQDYGKAREWYEKAAEGNYRDAIFNVGVIYNEGMGVPVDKDAARKWFTKAAELGDPDSMLNLCDLLAAGQGGPRDRSGALQWAEKALAAIEGQKTAQRPQARSNASDALVIIAENALFLGDFNRSLAAAEKAHGLDPSNLYTESNRANALMFLNRTDEARALYLSHRDEKLSADDARTWRQSVLDDFAEFRKAGLPAPRLMAEIEAAFAKPDATPK